MTEKKPTYAGAKLRNALPEHLRKTEKQQFCGWPDFGPPVTGAKQPARYRATTTVGIYTLSVRPVL
ncbi:hypothetical protein J6590_069323, partial [Homalodisca vitripennis]